jgi:hypothetical protein
LRGLPAQVSHGRPRERNAAENANRGLISGRAFNGAAFYLHLIGRPHWESEGDNNDRQCGET